MLAALSENLTATLKQFTAPGVLTDDAVKQGLREVRRVLLEADVSYELTRTFAECVREKAVVTMETAEEDLGVSSEVSSFVLPLDATVNMDGTALYQAVAVMLHRPDLRRSDGAGAAADDRAHGGVVRRADGGRGAGAATGPAPGRPGPAPSLAAVPAGRPG